MTVEMASCSDNEYIACYFNGGQVFTELGKPSIVAILSKMQVNVSVTLLFQNGPQTDGSGDHSWSCEQAQILC